MTEHVADVETPVVPSPDTAEISIIDPDELHVLQNLRALNIASEEIEHYGPAPQQIIEWFGPRDGKPVCFVHGGYLLENVNQNYLRPAALALGEAGYRVGLAGYRREVGKPEEALADMELLAHHDVLKGATWVGHCSGAALILNVIMNRELEPTHAVALAPLIDVTRDVSELEASSWIPTWLGGTPEDVPEIYEAFDPWLSYLQLGPDGFASRELHVDIIHGGADKTIPVARSRDLTGEPFNLAVVPEANHLDVVRPDHDAWILLLGALG